MIDTKALRSRILDLAIQGKLTEQLPSDGTAEELYQQIQAEKQALIKEGKIKKEKPLPEISDDEIPFDIPNNWKWVKLKNICTKIVDGDHNPPKGVDYETDYMMLSAQNINNNQLNFDRVRYLSEEVFCQENERTNLEKGDILLTIVGTIGRSCVFDIDGNFCFQRSVSVLKTLVYNKYLKYAFDISYIQKYMNDNATGAAQLGFYLNKLDKLFIPLPPLAEQKRIVERVEEIFRVLDTIDEAQEKYSADSQILKSKLITAGIQGKLTKQLPSDGTAEELYQQIQAEKQKLIKEGKLKKEKPLPPVSPEEVPFEIPHNWLWVRWGNLSESIQYGYNAPAKQSGRIKMVRITDIQDNKVQWNSVPYCDIDEESINNYILKNNDILFARTGGTVGKSFIVDNISEEAVYAGYLIRTRYSSNLCGKYLKLFMESDFYWKQLRQGTTATAQPNCNGQTLSKMIIPLPPLAEQKRIADVLERALVVIG